MTEEPRFSAPREEETEEEEEEEEQVLIGKEDLALRVDGTRSLERLMGITARVGGTTRPWYSKSLRRNEKADARQGSLNIAAAKKTIKAFAIEIHTSGGVSVRLLAAASFPTIPTANAAEDDRALLVQPCSTVPPLHQLLSLLPSVTAARQHWQRSGDDPTLKD